MRSTARLVLAAAVAFVIGACATPQTPRRATDAGRESVAASERAFARQSVEHGMRAAFLEYFADDGINFAPGPGNTRERFRARPDAIEPFVLDWHPAITAVARAGDLGFTTGPFTITGRAPAVREPAQGVFLSVWRRQADGNWRVIVDGGVSTNAPVPDAAFGEDPQPLSPIANAAESAGQKALFDLEARPLFGERGRRERLCSAACRRCAAYHRSDTASAGPRRDTRANSGAAAPVSMGDAGRRCLALGRSRLQLRPPASARCGRQTGRPLRPRVDARSRRALAHRRRADAAAGSGRLVRMPATKRVVRGRRAAVDRSRCARRRR